MNKYEQSFFHILVKQAASFDCVCMIDDATARPGIPKEPFENIVGVCTD
ncbi:MULTISPECIES: hypothetical protein [Ruminococcus]|nr:MULTISPECIES: hypothetical protein [Ruminococcus]MCR5021041.1 hypothetical protein [Ruminococcus sp.]